MYTNPRLHRSILFASHLYRRLQCSNEEIWPLKYFPFTAHNPQLWVARFKHDEESARRNKLENVLNMSNSQYLDNLYQMWRKNPKSVASSWDSFFKLFLADKPPEVTTENPSESVANKSITSHVESSSAQSARLKANGEMQGELFINGALDINATIRAYQARGHLIADIDPLGIQNPESHKLQGTPNLPPAVVVRQHLKGMTEADMNREFPLAPFTVIGGPKRSLPLRDILIRLNEVYCGHLGLEYTYIHDLVMLDWLRDKFEVPGAWELPTDHRQFIWINIMKAVTFEGFLARKFPTEKRFGLEGCESFIPAMVQCLETSAERGKNTNILIRVNHDILCFGSGDVKSKKRIFVSMMANPSHLEAIDPVIVGRVRAEQVEKNDFQYGKKSVAILVHGDAAFSGQGIVYETMHLTNLPEYTTGGVIHVVINNQIGFTTDPRYSRSSAHCTDVARVVNAPIFHIHGDDPDLVTYCSKVASEYRSDFHNDVVLDVVGYRRFGHNELDEPMLTQPLMYKRIKDHPNVLLIYTDKLLKEGVITEAFVKQSTASAVSEPDMIISLTIKETDKLLSIMDTGFEVTLDTILSSGQTKWGRQVGLVLLLPHGLEGQGPEHSSARLERYLKLCDDDCLYIPGTEPGAPQGETPEQIMTRQLFEINWIICNLTTPANLFHALRRQILMPFRKPLVRDLSLYPTLTQSRVVRIQVSWLQEEHKNQGSYGYVRDRIALALGMRLEDVEYIGRPPSASPATGSKLIHTKEYNDMVTAAMKLD
ncbi:unnamed protein product [Xylocopa violacea]|uniref:2-oxoglutarate dehydrogenase, mitochondrial n=1 Tax=Xylocopa violacea TaxID=135666 RepID=A0ABP1NFG5_XYLVO